MWLILSTIDMNLSNFILPIIVVILTVMVIRVISVYIPISLINLFKIEKHIPSSWILLLSWGSLRWALALMMVLMIPWVWDHWYEALIAFQESVWWSYGFSIKDFLLVLTIWVIMFTLFIKAPIIPFIMKQLKIDRLYRLEEFKFEEWNILANLKIIDKLDSSYKKAYITQIEYDDLKKKYTEKLNIAVESMKNVLWNKVWESKVLIKKAISLHALWIEKEYLKSLFFYNEIWEDNFKFILRKIEKQIERLEWNGSQLKKKWSIKSDYDIFSRFFQRQYEKNSTDLDAYIRNRTRLIITRKVIKELRILSEIDFGFDNEIFEEVIELYAGFSKSADEKRIKLFSDHKATINAIESRLINKSLLKLEEQVIKDLYSKEIITPKLYIRFQENIEKEMYSDIRKFV